MIRFVLHPGEITSPTDGDRHYIPAHELARLYEVDMRECVVVPDHGLLVGTRSAELLHLYPKNNWYAKVGPAERLQYPIQ
jgi:hypothetical protein